jgi:Domain of unknown function (DUF4169)
MTELINLRAARKRLNRQKDEARAQANRLAHGQPKHLRQIEAAKRAKDDRDFDQRLIKKIEKGEGP